MSGCNIISRFMFDSAFSKWYFVLVYLLSPPFERQTLVQKEQRKDGKLLTTGIISTAKFISCWNSSPFSKNLTWWYVK